MELGSGQGTEKLIHMGYNVISIEQNPDWQFRYHNNYIACPIKKYENYYWFDASYLSELPSYDFLLIDGPTGPNTKEYNNCRVGILDHLNLFNLSVPILVDDTNRPDERTIAEVLKKGREYKDYGRFIYIF